MKKLFVLFLLAALVPFTVGCGLFGDNDDTTPVNLTRLSASATLPVSAATANLRGSVAARLFAGFKMTINGVELVAETENDEGNGNYTVNFGAIVSSQQALDARAGLVPVIIKTIKNTEIKTYVDTADMTNAAPLAITVVSPTAGTFAVDLTTNPPTVGGQTTTTAPATSVVATAGSFKYTAPQTFEVTLSQDIFGTTFTTLPSVTEFEVEVRKAGGTYQEAMASDFSYSYNHTTKVLSVTLTGKTLTAGQAYEIALRGVMYTANNVSKYISAATFNFTAAASVQ